MKRRRLEKDRRRKQDRERKSEEEEENELPTYDNTYLADVNSSIIATAKSNDNGGFTEWSKVRTKCRTKTCGNISIKNEFDIKTFRMKA